MSAWTPKDLASQEFVTQKLSAKDRSFALNTTTRELESSQKRLETLENDLKAAEEANNNKPSRAAINELKQKANDTSLSQAQRDEASVEAAKLQNERDRLATAVDNAREKAFQTREYVSNLSVGQSNLLNAGAVPPGENSFAAPPGYQGRNSPAEQVADFQNPNPVPTTDQNLLPNQSVSTPISSELPSGFTLSPEGVPRLSMKLTPTDEELQQQEAEFISQESQRQAETQQQIDEAAFIKAEEQRQVETELGATQAEADFINAEAQLQVETELGATQGEADVINQAIAQKQVEEAFGATQAEADFINQTAEAQGEAARQASRGIPGAVNNTREQAIIQDTINYNQIPDWRVRLSLAPNATYLYKAAEPGILKPLQSTNGVVFPYTPSIGMSYSASYSPEELIHSNYKIYQYKSSSVEQVTITADFTAQDAKEAAYVLAVIHFFRSVTKMFYGKDQNPKAGVPPPLCYIYGMGDFQFNQHPLLISSFGYTLPSDVDYIRAGAPTLTGGQSSAGFNTPNNAQTASNNRMASSNVPVGGRPNPPNFTTQTNIEPTYIPTKLQIQVTALPVVTRKDISDNFSLKDYSTGLLMRGRQNARGGIW